MKPITLRFCKPTAKVAKETGCTGFLVTSSSLTAEQMEFIERWWERNHTELSYGQTITVPQASD